MYPRKKKLYEKDGFFLEISITYTWIFIFYFKKLFLEF